MNRTRPPIHKITQLSRPARKAIQARQSQRRVAENLACGISPELAGLIKIRKVKTGINLTPYLILQGQNTRYNLYLLCRGDGNAVICLYQGFAIRLCTISWSIYVEHKVSWLEFSKYLNQSYTVFRLIGDLSQDIDMIEVCFRERQPKCDLCCWPCTLF